MPSVTSLLRALIRDELQSLRLGDVAVVTSAPGKADGDENTYECSARLRESDLELRHVPMLTPHVGMVSAPAVGDLVLIQYVGGDPNRPLIVGRLYSDEAEPPIHEADEWRIESKLKGETKLALDKEGSVVVTAGKTTITVKKDGNIELIGEADLKIEVKGKVEVKCTDAKVDASGKVELGSGGGGVITTTSHKCYYTGAPLKGSQNVTAKD